MKRQRALALLRRGKQELQTRFSVTQLALLGANTRDIAMSGIADGTIRSIIGNDVTKPLPPPKALNNLAQS